MNNIMENIKIEGLFGFKNIYWQFKKTNILVGKNGAGKSTILSLIYNTLLAENKNNNNKELFLRVAITFSDKKVVYSLPNYFGIKGDIPDEVEKFLKSDLSQPIAPPSSPVTHKEDSNSGAFLAGSLLGFLVGGSTGISLATGIGALLLAQNNTNKNSIKKNMEHRISKESNFDIEFISTANMNANSLHEIKTSDGHTAHILDYEIQSQVNRLVTLNKSDLNSKLIESLNSMFSETNKKISLNINNEFEIKYRNTLISFESLSSGEKQIIYIFLKVVIASHSGAIILMDEPEISLHLSWQEKLLTEIRKVNSISQIIIVTHSPAIVMKGWLDCLTDIKDIFVDEVDFKEVG